MRRVDATSQKPNNSRSSEEAQNENTINLIVIMRMIEICDDLAWEFDILIIDNI